MGKKMMMTRSVGCCKVLLVDRESGRKLLRETVRFRGCTFLIQLGTLLRPARGREQICSVRGNLTLNVFCNFSSM